MPDKTDTEVTTTPMSNENPSEGNDESSNLDANVETTPAGFTNSFQAFLDNALHNLEVQFGEYSMEGSFWQISSCSLQRNGEA